MPELTLTPVSNSAIALTGIATGGTTENPGRFTTVPYFGPSAYDGTQLVVMDDENTTTGVIQWQCNSTSTGEMIHLTGGSNMTGSGGSGPNLIALGVNYGGVGMFINNYTTGVGLKITNRNTGSNSAAWGFLLSQSSTAAEGMYLSQESSTAKMPLKIVNAPIGSVGGDGASTNQILTEWRRSQSSTGDTLLIRFRVDGALFDVPTTVTDTLIAETVEAQASAAYIGFYDTGGTTNQRRFRLKQSSGSFLIQKLTDAGSASSILTIDQSGNITPVDGANLVLNATTGMKVGTATGQKLGFWGATPVAQQVLATGAGATADNIISLLQTLGLCKQS